MNKLTPIFLRHASAMIDRISCVLSERGMEILSNPLDRMNRNLAQNSEVLDAEDFKRTCYHEAGQALVHNALLPDYPTTKICVIEYGDNYGYIYDDTHKMPAATRGQLINRLAGMYGGFVAEKIVFGDDGITEGVEEDLEDIDEIVREMIQLYGMGTDRIFLPPAHAKTIGVKILGFSVYHYREERDQKMSGAQKDRYDAAAQEIMSEARAKAENVLNDNRDALDRLAREVGIQRILLRQEIKDILSLDPSRT